MALTHVPVLLCLTLASVPYPGPIRVCTTTQLSRVESSITFISIALRPTSDRLGALFENVPLSVCVSNFLSSCWLVHASRSDMIVIVSSGVSKYSIGAHAA